MKRIGYLIGAIAVIALVIGITATAKSPKIDANVPARESESKEKNPDIPHVMSYYGYLEDSNGNPVTANKDMEFSIWDHWDAGNKLYTWQSTIWVEKGHFVAHIGTGGEIPLNIFTGGTGRWLEVIVEGDTVKPRVYLTSTGYAYVSAQADNATKWNSHGWGDKYPSATQSDNATKWNNHSWGIKYPDADKLDNYTSSDFIRWAQSAGASSGKVLKWNGSQWAPGTDNTGGGGVTSISQGTGITLSPNPITGTGTVSFNTSYTVPKADKVDGFHASSTPTANKILPLDSQKRFYLETSVPHERAIVGHNTGDDGCGVYGYAEVQGVFGYSTDGNGVQGVAGPYADYGVYYSGGLGGTGKKSTIVKGSKGPTEIYAMESPELWFEDFGSGKLINGHMHIDLDSDLSETVTINANHPMKVFVQLKDNCNGVYVKTSVNGFDVYELNNGTSNAEFDYRIVAKRKGYETERMKVMECCYTDRNLYPDDNDPAIPPYWKEKRQTMRR